MKSVCIVVYAEQRSMNVALGEKACLMLQNDAVATRESSPCS